MSNRRLWLGAFASFALVFLLTAHWQVGQVSDGVAAAWPGWNLAHHGSLWLDGSGAPRNFAIYPSPNGHLTAGRTMGVILAGIPVPLLLGWTGLSATAGGALMAALVTAAALATMLLVLTDLVDRRAAILGALVLGLGTCLWPVAAAELWTHGPDALWLSLALLMASRGRDWWAGGLFAAAFVTRPHLALAAACVGVAVALTRRTVRPLVAYGLLGGIATGAMVLWNRLYYGEFSLFGFYQSYAPGQITGGFDPMAYLKNLAGFFVSPSNGLLLFSPVAVLALVVIARRWRDAPAWVLGSFVGGVLYLLVQCKLNAFTGGGGFYGYRLILETVVLCTPLAVYAISRETSPLLRKAVVASSYASVAVIAFGALLTPYWRGTPPGSDWTLWYPTVVWRAAGIAVIPVLLIITAGLGLTALLLRRYPDWPASTAGRERASAAAA